MKIARKSYTHWIYLGGFVLMWWLYGTSFGGEWDKNITLVIYDALHSQTITDWLIFITRYTLGSYVGVFLFLVYLAYKKDRSAVLMTGLLMILLSIIYLFLNAYVARLRPFEDIPGVAQLVSSNLMWQYSFPSGHSAFAFFIAYFLTNHYKYNAKINLAFYLLAFLVAFSRVYLGVHFVIDVMAGAFLGLFLAEVGVRITNYK
ncbi:MAG: phosphatase PAP2 family protein [Patescibacteria group bacterium]